MLKSTDGKTGLEYLKKRALSDKTITHFGLGFSPKAPDALYRYLKEKSYTDDIIKESGLVVYSEKGARDRFWNRVIFPIMDTNNRVIAFGGRVLGDGLPKYLNSPETLIFDKSATLYGLNFAKKSKRKFLLLCEGYMDVIALHQAGFDNAVASLGTAFNEKHARLLKRYTDTVILTQDSDTAGTNAKIKAFPILYSAGLNVKVLEIEGAKDPDELIRLKGADAYEKFISEAKNGFLFMIEVLKRGYNLSDPAEKTAFYNAVAERLCMFKESLERANYTDSVSTNFMIDHDELKRMVERRFELGGTAASGIIPADRPVSSERRKASAQQTEDNNRLKYEMLLISWLCERPELGGAVFKYIEPEQFNTPVLKELAVMLKNKEIIDEAGFLDEMHSDESGMKLAAEVFSLGESKDGIGSLSKADIEKGLTEAVRAVKLADIDRRKKETGVDLQKLGQLIKEKNELLKLYVRIEDEAVKET